MTVRGKSGKEILACFVCFNSKFLVFNFALEKKPTISFISLHLSSLWELAFPFSTSHTGYFLQLQALNCQRVPWVIYLAILPCLLVNLLFSTYLTILFLAFLCIILFPPTDSTLPLQCRHISCLNLPWAILSPKYLFTAKTLLFVTLCCCIREGGGFTSPKFCQYRHLCVSFLAAVIASGENQILLPACFSHLARQWSSPWRCTSHSLAGSLHCSFGYEHLFCQTPMGGDELGWANCALGAQLSLCYLHAIWIPARHSVLRDLAPTPVLCLITLAQWAAGEQNAQLSLQ